MRIPSEGERQIAESFARFSENTRIAVSAMALMHDVIVTELTPAIAAMGSALRQQREQRISAPDA